MKQSKHIITEEEFHAYIDGWLDTKQRLLVEQYLAEHPEEAERVRAYQQMNVSLQQAYTAQLQEPVP